MNSISVACVYIGVGLTTWAWATYQGTCPWRKLIPSSAAAIYYHSFSAWGRALGHFSVRISMPSGVVMCRKSDCWVFMEATSPPWSEDPLSSHHPSSLTLTVFHHSFLDASKPWIFILSYRCSTWGWALHRHLLCILWPAMVPSDSLHLLWKISS